jgi:transglutaminase-like putative cysteine protease
VATSRIRLPWQSPEARSAPPDDLATLCLSLVTLAVALSMGRLFQGGTWMAYGIAAAVIGHGLAWGLRRLGAGLVVTSIASPLCSLLVAIELVVPQATTFGLPTPFTLETLGQALTDAQGAFRTAVPPVTPTTGFLALSVVGVCMTAFLADWAAFRMRTAFEACLPALGLFAFAAVLGARSHRAASAAAFAAAALAFLIVQRANLDRSHTPWFGGLSRGALPSLLTTGAVLGAVAVIGALVVSTHVPGATAKPVLSFKKGAGRSNPGSRSTVSPLVDIRTRLNAFTGAEVFTVRAERPAYWRLTSLDQFDGQIWSSNERYAASKGQLEKPSATGSTLVQEVAITGLASIWLPAAYRPAQVQGVEGLSYSPGSASVISKSETSDGLRYTLTSEVPNPTREALQQAPASASGRSALGDDLDRYLEIGGTVSRRVRLQAEQLARGQTTAYGRARALQDFFRSPAFTYDLEVAAGHSGNAVDRFLFDTKRGYCEQFAGSYALLARLMGLPARVAVGFQPGLKAAGTFTVKDREAHAWPEVYFEGIGWTAFEPTPGRANPQAQDYTGVPYAPQAAEAEADPTTPATVPSPEATTPTSAPPAEPPAPEATPPDSDRAGAGLLSFLRRILPLVLGLALVGLLVGGSAGLVAWERRTRRGRAAGSPETRVQAAWEEALQALAAARMGSRPGETIDELLARLGPPTPDASRTPLATAAPSDAPAPLGAAALQALRRLGRAVAHTAYTGQAATARLAEDAEADRATIIAACRVDLGRKGRLQADLDPRAALARLRTDRARTTF